MALVLSTVGMIGSTPGYGHDVAKSAAKTNGEQQEQRGMAKVETDISRLLTKLRLLGLFAGGGLGGVEHTSHPATLARFSHWCMPKRRISPRCHPFSSP
jgi:hypothetical protein